MLKHLRQRFWHNTFSKHFLIYDKHRRPSFLTPHTHLLWKWFLWLSKAAASLNLRFFPPPSPLNIYPVNLATNSTQKEQKNDTAMQKKKHLGHLVANLVSGTQKIGGGGRKLRWCIETFMYTLRKKIGCRRSCARFCCLSLEKDDD